MKTILIILSGIILFSGCDCDDSARTFPHQFSRGYNTLYPKKEQLFYTKIQITDSLSKDTSGFIFYFLNTLRDFQEYEFQQDTGMPVQKTQGEFTVKFNKHVTEDTFSFIKINVVSKDKKIKKFEMQLSFDPKIVQERSGRTGVKDGLYIRKTDVGFLEIPGEDFIPEPPAEDEKKFLLDEFGDRIKDISTENEKINMLAREVINLLEPYRGIPGNSMDTISAVKQLMEIKLKKGNVYCTNIAQIFLSACLSFDIPARFVGLGNTYDESPDPAIFHSDYHTTVEVFDKEEKSWHLVDLSFYLLEVKSENGKALNFVDFLYLLNSPEEQKRLLVSEYDAEQKKVNVLKIREANNFLKLMDYYKQNQKFFFPHKKGSFSF